MIYVQRPNNNSNKYNTVFESHLKVLFHPEPSNMKHTGHFKTTDGGKEDFAWQKEKLAALFGYFFFYYSERRLFLTSSIFTSSQRYIF